MSAIIPRGVQRKSEKGVAILGVGLCDAREEAFVLMVCDGIALGIAFQRAGFTSSTKDAPSKLFELDRIQKRANEIMEARRTTNVVTLSEVTDMLHRVFVGAWHKEEFSAAHNAAFSLARLYGHVTDKSTVEVIRRPSRDPDAPSEQALSSWVNSLPIIEHEPEPGIAPLSRAPADLLGTPPDSLPAVADSSPALAVSRETLATAADSLATGADTLAPFGYHAGEKPNDFNGLEICSPSVQAGGRPENGAPSRAVTGTPRSGARAELLDPTGGSRKTPPAPDRQVPVLTGEYPPIEELF